MKIKVTTEQDVGAPINMQGGIFASLVAIREKLRDGSSTIGILRRTIIEGIDPQVLRPDVIAGRIKLCRAWFIQEKIVASGSGAALTEGLPVWYTCLECVPEDAWPKEDGEYDITGVVIHCHNPQGNDPGVIEIEFTVYTTFKLYLEGPPPISARGLLDPKERPATAPKRKKQSAMA